jgi:WD40 repeat protein
MTTTLPSPYSYQLGGSLAVNHPSYISRRADHDFYQWLKQGEFCYVLNSRQVGKSSLRIQIMNKLQLEGIACAEVDLTGIGSRQITPEQWYGGIIQELINSLELKIDRRSWWRVHDDLSPVNRFKIFIEQVLLPEVKQNIVIFVDEIDNVLRLRFKDDFFAVIRSCFNKRAESPEYRRLTFALLGVASPADLIQDRAVTPFNVGRAIELNGFRLQEALSLARGLEGKVSNPKAVLQQVLFWTNGQPFLTQKLCSLIQSTPSFIPADAEAEQVTALIQAKILKNWESQDTPEHLKTISDRLLYSEQRSSRLLGMYQQILQKGAIVANNSPEQTELRLSGLVVQQQGKLNVYNPIYASVFNQEWVSQQLADLRPYAESFAAWLASDYQDESRLLRRQALHSAQEWAADKSLSDADYQFLAASQDLNKREIQAALELEKEASLILSDANQTLHKAQKKAQQTIRRGFIGLILTSGISIIILIWISLRVKTAETQKKWAEVAELNARSTSNLLSNHQLEALLDSIKATHQVLNQDAPPNLQDQTEKKLRQVLDVVQERNRLEKHFSRVNSVRFSPDGQTIASASDDGTVKLWNQDGKDLITLGKNLGRVYSVSFSPDGKTIAANNDSGIIKLWNFSGKELITLKHPSTVYSHHFSPDGRAIATANGDGTVKLWNINGKEIKTLKQNQGRVYDVSFSPNGQIIATANDDGTIKLWNHGREEFRTLRGHGGSVYSISFSPNGQTIASASADRTIKLWDRNGTEVKTLWGHSGTIYSVIFSSDGQTIASASGDKTIKLWNLEGSELDSFRGHGDDVRDISFSPNTNMIASASSDSSIRLWTSNRALLRTLNKHRLRVYSISFSPDGKTLASASGDKTIKLWNLDGKELQTLRSHSDEINSIEFSPDGKKLVSASGDKTIKLWSLDGKELKTLRGHQGSVYTARFMPDGQVLVSASADKTVKLWNLSGQILRTLKAHEDEVNTISSSPDGQLLASASDDKMIKLWSRNGKVIKTLRGHSSKVYSVTFSPNGKTLASSSLDKTVKLWSKDGILLKTLTGHTAGIYSVNFSRDGQLFASTSADKTIQLWDHSGRKLTTLWQHNGSVNDINFSPDRKILATASGDKTIKLWSLNYLKLQALDLHQLLAHSCNWLQDYLQAKDDFSQDEHDLCIKKMRF